MVISTRRIADRLLLPLWLAIDYHLYNHCMQFSEIYMENTYSLHAARIISSFLNLLSSPLLSSTLLLHRQLTALTSTWCNEMKVFLFSNTWFIISSRHFVWFDFSYFLFAVLKMFLGQNVYFALVFLHFLPIICSILTSQVYKKEKKLNWLETNYSGNYDIW